MSLLQTPKEEHHANMDKLYSSQEFGYSDVKYEQPEYMKRIRSFLIISAKIDALLQYIGPTNENYNIRIKIFNSIVSLLTNNQQDSLIVPYGSFIGTCYLISSDLDFCCWNPDSNPNDDSQTVYKLLQDFSEATNVQLINADVPVVKCLIKNIGVDISFSYPGGIAVMCLIEYLDQTLGNGNLFKRSLLLLQNYFYNELHILGSHNFMLSSFGLRTMLMFILLNQSNLVSPIQVMYAFFAYFRNFDFERNVITIFGITSVEQFTAKPASEVLQELQEQFIRSSDIGQQQRESLVRQVNHLSTCKEISENSLVNKSEYFGILQSDLEIQETDSQEIKALKQQLISVKGSSFGTIEQLLLAHIEMFSQPQNKQHFRQKNVNIADPLCPSNNIGRSFNQQSTKRFNRCISVAFERISALMSKTARGEISELEVAADTDLLFSCTLAQTKHRGTLRLSGLGSHKILEAVHVVTARAMGLRKTGLALAPSNRGIVKNALDCINVNLDDK